MLRILAFFIASVLILTRGVAAESHGITAVPQRLKLLQHNGTWPKVLERYEAQ